MRLFSSFAEGAPGAGLLIMRLAAGATLIGRAVIALATGLALGSAALQALALLVGILLVAGLWTPFAAALAAGLGAWGALSDPGDWAFDALLAALSVALALLGPGAWSIDARLFGWKRVEIRQTKGGAEPPS